ncbi:hypothetical protein AAGS61_17750 [Lysinibacillus sp. KU-BSD001]|uniref:hypothetical protein n=1 Tax=Lysinibacillus sp. KU-BSD001 TaxID=3141328 RepID=UPI0036E452A3
MNLSLKQQIKQLAREQYFVYLGEFIYFSSASELIVWLSSEMTPFELEHLAYRLGNTHMEELKKSGCDTPAEIYVFEHEYVFVLQGKSEKLFIYSCDFIDIDDEHIFVSPNESAFK